MEAIAPILDAVYDTFRALGYDGSPCTVATPDAPCSEIVDPFAGVFVLGVG